MKEVLRQVFTRAEAVRVRNALNPLLWLTALSTPTLLFFAWLFHEAAVIQWFLVIFALIPSSATVIAYFKFLASDPDRLQSEEYLLEHFRLSVMERKGETALEIEAKPPSETFLDSEEVDR